MAQLTRSVDVVCSTLLLAKQAKCWIAQLGKSRQPAEHSAMTEHTDCQRGVWVVIIDLRSREGLKSKQLQRYGKCGCHSRPNSCCSRVPGFDDRLGLVHDYPWEYPTIRCPTSD
jgi:hypothetical protein